MKFATYTAAGQERVGALSRDGTRLFDLVQPGIATDMLDLIARYAQVRSAIEKLVTSGLPDHSISDVELLAPLPRPLRNIFCVGKNYVEHAAEFGRSGFDSGALGGSDIPEYPIVFSKPPSSVVGPKVAIDSRLDPYGSVDYEGELAVVIGKAGRVEASDEPLDFVFGYTILNDVTSRELQKRHKQWLLGKGIDTFAPMGPTITTTDDVVDFGKKTLRTWVNGELRQSAKLGDLIFDVATLIRTIGRSISFVPGDVIATGTPLGVGIGFSPPQYLNAGDIVRIEIEGLGVLENPVV